MHPEFAVSHYGPAALFVGGLVGGPVLVTLGGLVSHQHLMAPSVALASAWSGSAASNQLLYLIGAVFRDRPALVRLFNKPLARKALNRVQRSPVGFVMAYRFVMGLRSISPLVLGMTGAVSGVRFAVLNIVAALIWAAAFIALGYGSGTTMTLLLGRARSIDRDLFIAAALLAIIGAVMLWRKRRQTA